MRFTKQEIEGIVNKIASSIPLEEFPIDFARIIHFISESVVIYKAKFDDSNIAGMCKKIGNQYEIYVNRGESDTRQRFTIAHELGHITLGHLVDGNTEKVDKFRGSSYSEEEQKEEQEANAFASSLLMPAKYVNSLVKKGESLEKMCSRFGVSEQAMKIRLFNLGHNI